MPVPTVTELNEGKEDLDDLEAIVNGFVSVATRLGGTKQSLSQLLSNVTHGAITAYSSSTTYTTIDQWVSYVDTSVSPQTTTVYRPIPEELPIAVTSPQTTAPDPNKWIVAAGYKLGDRLHPSVSTYAALRAILDIGIPDETVITVTDDGVTGDFILKTDASSPHPITDNGGTLIRDTGNQYAERVDLEGVTTLEQFGATPESGVPVTNSTTAIANAISDADSNRKWLTDRGENNYLASVIDLEDFNVGRFKMSGIDNTQFYASANIASGPFLDAGWDSSDTTHPSSIQFGDVGGFSIRSNGFTLNYGASFDQYRRGYAGPIRVYGNASADELEHGFKYNFSWVANFDKMLAQDHYGRGHQFGTSSLNAVTCTNFSAASSRTTAINYFFDGGNSILLISPNSEGSVLRGFEFESDVRSITIVNPHIEGANSGFFKTNADNNGCSVKIIGGACFTCPDALDFSGAMADLNIQGFAFYNLTNISDLDIQINATTAVLNDITAVTTGGTQATDAEIINNITLGANCERCIVNGKDIAGITKFTSPAPREFFSVTINPGTPVELTSAYLSSMHRRTVKLFAAQRTSSSTIGHINSIITVTEDDTIDQDSITSRNGATGLTIAFDAATDQLTIDGSVAGTCRVEMEHWRI